MGGLLPQALRRRIADVFGDSEHPAFGQLATLGADGPEVRTVHFRFSAELATLVFNTHAGSRKLAALSPSITAAACYHDVARNFQWLWRFTSRVVGAREQGELAAARGEQWRISREDLRRCYWLDAGGVGPGGLEAVCPSFLSVVCDCTYWQLYEMNEQRYETGERTEYHRQADGRWSEHRLPLLFTPAG